jgi:hypothetical protein
MKTKEAVKETQNTMKTLIALAVILTATVTLNAQETIESRVGVDAIVQIPGDAPTPVTSIDVPAGLWLISGQINFFESAEHGTVFVGGNISLNDVSLSTDGHEHCPWCGSGSQAVGNQSDSRTVWRSGKALLILATKRQQ